MDSEIPEIQGYLEKRKYWYKYYEDYCPVCTSTTIEKVRIYDEPKPKEYLKRHIIEESYDGCDY